MRTRRTKRIDAGMVRLMTSVSALPDPCVSTATTMNSVWQGARRSQRIMVWAAYGECVTILVDQARWPWRGTTWCHLVSDDDLEELHAFAARLGCRRVSFQGDHYDIDIDTREIAIEFGATALDSRDLVRRLKAAGLRLRPSSYEKWSMVDQWQQIQGVADVVDRAPLSDALRDLVDRYLEAQVLDRATGAYLLARTGGTAFMVFGEGDTPNVAEQIDAGVHVRTDRFERWSVELVDPPLRPDQ